MARKNEVNKNDFSIDTGNGTIKFDAVFIGMHGTPGRMESCRVILIH
jgi:D-alanine-D-alanine ligase